jgi:hypothetical protein
MKTKISKAAGGKTPIVIRSIKVRKTADFWPETLQTMREWADTSTKEKYNQST